MPNHHGERFALQANGLIADQSARAKPRRDLFVREAEPAVSVIQAEVLKLVGSKIGNHHTPARSQQPRRLANHARGLVCKMEDLMNRSQIDGVVIEGKRVHVRQPHVVVTQSGSLKICTGNGEHLVREIYTNAPGHVRRQNLENSTGAGADIEDIVVLAARDSIDKYLLNPLFGYMERTNLIPP